jgi:hypothetical protein
VGSAGGRRRPGDWQWRGPVGCSSPPLRVVAATFLELLAASVADGWEINNENEQTLAFLPTTTDQTKCPFYPHPS